MSFWLTVPLLAGKSGSGKSPVMNGTSTFSVQPRPRGPREQRHRHPQQAVERGVFTRSARVVARSSVRPASALSWRVKGSAASSVGSSGARGVASRASARRGGSVPSSAVSAGRVARSVSRSAGIEADSAWSSAASAPAVGAEVGHEALQRLLVLGQRAAVRAVPRKPRRTSSLGRSPRGASEATAGRAGPARHRARHGSGIPPRRRRGRSTARRAASGGRCAYRAGAWPARRRAAPARRSGRAGSRRRRPARGATGVPGRRSTKKLPSKKMRGRIFSRASRAAAAPSVRAPSSPARRPPSRGSTTTLPTSTPAIRTGERAARLRHLFELARTA